MSDEAIEQSPSNKEENENGEKPSDSSMETESKGDTSVEKENDEKSDEVDNKNADDADNGDDAGNEEEEEEEEEELQAGLLEQPLVLEEGRKRERKKVENFAATQEVRNKTPNRLKIEEGKGRSLGDIPYIEYMIGRTKAEKLKLCHKILFRRPHVKNNEVKKNIRQFSGFPFSNTDPEYKKRQDLLNGVAMAELKATMTVLDIQRSGKKEELIERLLTWLEEPKDSERKIPQPKSKRKSKGDKSGKTRKRKRSSSAKGEKKKTVKKGSGSDEEEEDDDADKTKDSDDEVSDIDDSDDDDDKSDEEKEPPKKKAKVETPKEKKVKKKVEVESDSEKESDEEEPPKKKAKAVTPKQKKEKKEKEKKKPTPKAKVQKTTPKKKTTTPKKKAKVVIDDVPDITSDSDSDDEPLQKKTSSPPTNDELKDVIKSMLDKANLEQVTMKTILKDVFAKYPTFDLSERKDFIKNTVKQIIS